MKQQVTLRIPANSKFVATTRVTTASVAAELGFSIDEIEALRVGVNELAAVLIEWAQDHGCEEIELVCATDADTLEVRGAVVGAIRDEGRGAAARSSVGSTNLDELTAQILAGVVDDHCVQGPNGRIVKRRSTA